MARASSAKVFFVLEMEGPHKMATGGVALMTLRPVWRRDTVMRGGANWSNKILCRKEAARREDE